MKTSDFYYELPKELIAQSPCPDREHSRLLAYDRSTGKIEDICRALGVAEEHLRVVVPLPKNMPEITKAIHEEVEYKGLSVIIARRECIQTLRRHLKQQQKAKAKEAK